MKTNPPLKPEEIVLLHPIIAVLVFLMICVCIWQLIPKRYLPTTKSDFAKWYAVDKKTFNKWIKHFCATLYPNLKEYQRKRKLSIEESKSIIKILGQPQYFPILSKKDIITYSDSSYGVLRRCVYAFPKHFGLTIPAFKANQKFPPKISYQIMKQFDPDRVEMVKDAYANGDDLTTLNFNEIS